MSLKEWFAQRSGQALLQNIGQIAASLKTLEQLVTIREEKDDTPLIEPAAVLKRWEPEPDDFFVNRYNEAPWAFPSVREEYSETFLFHRKEMGWHFSGTISGKSRDEIDGMTVCGDAGSDAFLSGQKMTLLAFAKWIGHSHPYYLLGKSDAQKEFNWSRAKQDLEAHLNDEEKRRKEEIEADKSDTKLKESLANLQMLRGEIEEQLSHTDYNSAQDFAEGIGNAIYADGKDDAFGLDEAMSEAAWGYDYSPKAYACWRQARYFALWLEEREMKRGE